MELWIRSQDREKMCKVNKLYIKGVGIYSNCDNYNDDYDYLGLYKTKERALEVLDEIQCHLVNINDSRDSYFYVYEMPID